MTRLHVEEAALRGFLAAFPISTGTSYGQSRYADKREALGCRSCIQQSHAGGMPVHSLKSLMLKYLFRLNAGAVYVLIFCACTIFLSA